MSKKLPATTALDKACNIFFNPAFIHPPPQYSTLLRIPHLFGAQVYNLKQNWQGLASWRPKVPQTNTALSAQSFCQPKPPTVPQITHVATAAGEAMRLLTALNGALSSRLPVRDRQGSRPDQAAAAIYRKAQEAPEQEATRLCTESTTSGLTAQLQPRSLPCPETQARPYPRGI